MFCFSRPDRPAIERFLESQSSLGLTYPSIGSTQGTPPTGYVVDHTRAKLGEGEAVFKAAQAAIREWKPFQLGWVEPCWPDTPIATNQAVAILVRALGLWSLNACRIVHVIEEEREFGFAYGTLPDHAESGEERFTIQWDQNDNSVWYDILAFSRANHPLARIAYPLTRRLQKRFARESVTAMQQAITEPSAGCDAESAA